MQFEFAGTLDLPDGRYLARDSADDDGQSVLVIETLGAPPPPSRRRRRPQEADAAAEATFLPVVKSTTVWASRPFETAGTAAEWLDRATSTEEAIDSLVSEGIGLLNRALYAQAAASANPRGAELSPEQAISVRVGFGSGEEVASGRFAQARDVDVRVPARSRRQRREEELRPQERVAAVLGQRERIDACEPLLLRARADLDAGRLREAALQLQVGIETLLVELAGALIDPQHEEDMAALSARRNEAVEAAELAVRGDLGAEREQSVRELLEIGERVLRRRRVLRG